MPYYTNDDNDVDDFTEYDPMPYSGGYDITVTYGRSIPPSDETCYPLSSLSGDAFEYQRPNFSSNHDSSAYDDQALKTEYSSYARPGPVGSGSDFGRKPNSGYGGRTEVEYGRKTESEHGSGYGGRIESDYVKPSYGGHEDDGDDGHKKHVSLRNFKLKLKLRFC